MITTPRSSSRSFTPRRILAAACILLAIATTAGAQKAMPVAPGSLDAILKQAAAYDGGIASDALWKLREYVYARRDDAAGRAECEATLLAFLKGSATPTAKMAATRLLRVIAGDTAIPSLAAMLSDPRSADYAIYVLQPMPGGTAEAALVQALKTARGPVKTAVVVALGQRRAASALPLLEPMLRDPALAATAAVAIGRIGGPAAAKALASAYATASVESKRVLAASMLEAADGLLAVPDTEAARGVFDTLVADRSLPGPIRRAALIGNISAVGPRAASLLVVMLGGDDAEGRDAAVARIRDVIPPDGVGPVCELLPRLPESTEVQVLAALARYPAERVRPAVLQAAKSSSPDVRVAALRALESVGDASSVPFLAETAASAQKGPVQDAARRTLGMLRGRDVDDAIAAGLKQPPSDAVAAELLKAVADRRIFLAKPAVSAALAAPSAAVRIEALKTLRAIGSPSDASPVLDLLIKTDDESERDEAGKSVAALLQKTAGAAGRSQLIRTRLAAEKDAAARAKLIALLPSTADGSALPVLRKALEDPSADVVDAAARAIAEWPTATARDDMLKLARDAKDETHRLLAIAGLVRLTSLDPNRLPQAAVADLKQASGLAWRPEEQKLILGALTTFPCQDALDVAKGFLQNDALKAEAQAAVDKITPKLAKDEKR
jgi:HEAT repeat protein